MKEREERDRAVDLEQLVKELQRDLADREDLIQQMKEESFSVASYVPSPPGSPFVMSPHTGSPTNM